MKKHLFIKVAEFAYKHPEGFSYNDLVREKIIEGDSEDSIMRRHFDNAYNRDKWDSKTTLDTMFLIIERKEFSIDSKCILTFDAFFNYFDYLEFQEARKASTQAIDASRKAIRIAWATLLVSILFSVIGIVVQLWTSSFSIKIDEAQFQNITNLMQNK